MNRTVSDLPPIELDSLRGGVLFDGRFKLAERVPRWVALRRFRAREQKTGEDRMLLFVDQRVADRLAEVQWDSVTCEALSDGVLKVVGVGEFRGLSYFEAEWVEATPLVDYIRLRGPISRQQAATFLDNLASVVDRALVIGLPSPRLSPGSVMVMERGDPPVSFDPLVFPYPLHGESEATSPRDTAKLACALLGIEDERGNFSGGLPDAFVALVEQQLSGSREDSPVLALRGLAAALRQPARTALPERRNSSLPQAVTPLPIISKQSTLLDDKGKPLVLSNGRRRKLSSAESEIPAPKSHSYWNLLSLLFAVLTFLVVLGFAGLTLQAIYTPVVVVEAAGRSPARQTTSETGDEVSRQIAEARSLQHHGSVHSALKSWLGLLRQHPDRTEIQDGATAAVTGLFSDEENIRSGLRPGTMPLLEQLSESGVPAADYLLARVLWTSDQETARTRLIRAAREGHQEARLWCAEEGIDYDAN